MIFSAQYHFKCLVKLLRSPSIITMHSKVLYTKTRQNKVEVRYLAPLATDVAGLTTPTGNVTFHSSCHCACTKRCDLTLP